MKRLISPILIAVLLLSVSACKSQTQSGESAASPKEPVASTNTQQAASTDAVELNRPVEIDMYTDFVCPWCYIGAERMSALLERYQFTERVRVNHRVYLLAPHTPEEGVNIADNLRQKYGREPSEMFARVESVAHEAGLPLDYSKLERSYPTLRAHALVLHAADKGTQDTLKRDIFRANFVEARNINEVEVLVELGEQHGFTAQEVRDIVTSDQELDAVRSKARASVQAAQGVPYFIMNEGKGLSGAQPEETLLEAIEHAGQ